MQILTVTQPADIFPSRIEYYQCVHAEAQQQANLSKKPVNLFEVEPGVFGFRFEEYGKGEGYITTLQPE